MVWAFDWGVYGKDVYFYTIINLIFCTILTLALKRPSIDIGYFANVISFSLLIYVVFRFVARRSSIKIQLGCECTKSIAPAVVWVDFFSFGAMFFLETIVQDRVDEDPLSHLFSISIRLVFAIVAILPLVNCSVYLFCKMRKSAIQGSREDAD
jgi:hypothetical protein